MAGVAVTVMLLAGLLGPSFGALHSRQLDFGSRDSECRDTEHMLVNSIPISCNQALERLLASGRDLTRVGNIGDLCQIYCLFPLSQAAQGCPEITDVYEIISRACCQYGRGRRCFDLVPLVAPLSLHCNFSNEAPTCSDTCSVALRNVNTGLGCCFSTLFNMSGGGERYPFSRSELWERCEQPIPGGECAGCSHAWSLGATGAGIAAMLAIGLCLTL